ncbi:MAG TPA: ribonuclease P protein component [Flavobacteriales bacterium]
MTTPASGTTLGKEERLSGRELISAVVKSGRSVNVAPFRLMGLITELGTDSTAQVAFSIPKRNVKRAVVRNRIRRLMREAYRTEKERLHAPLRATGKQCAWLFVYQGRTPVDLAETRRKISAAIERWLQQHLPA